VRASTLIVRETPYVKAARSLCQSTPGILVRHILPNALSSIVVQSALRTGIAILVAAGLGFLGLGAQPTVRYVALSRAGAPGPVWLPCEHVYDVDGRRAVSVQ
jgi:ABC-type dipeptide/oligopeptide/nickel transport system permease subunit